MDNPVVRGGHCRPAVVLALPRLRVLDGQVVTADERAEAELAAQPPPPPPAEPELVPRIPVVDIAMNILRAKPCSWQTPTLGSAVSRGERPSLLAMTPSASSLGLQVMATSVLRPPAPQPSKGRKPQPGAPRR